MSEEKSLSKGRSRNDSQVQDLHANSNNEPSFLSRIGASASGLSRSSHRRPPPASATCDLMSLHVSAPKGESSSSSSQRFSVSPAQAHRAAQQLDSSLLGIRDSFRTKTWTRHHAQDGFDQWSTSSSNSSNDRPVTHQVPRFSEPQSPSQIERAPTNEKIRTVPREQNGDIVLSDGMAVVSHLFTPTFGTDDAPSVIWEPFTSSQASDANSAWPRPGINPDTISVSTLVAPNQNSPAAQKRPVQQSAQNIMSARANTSESTLPLVHCICRSDNFEDPNVSPSFKSYGLVPDFQNLRSTSMNSKQRNRMGFVTERDGDDEEILKPWLDILDRYQDDVWGDVLPLVQEAREELQEAEDKTPGLSIPGEGPAVQRLKMVLQHMSYSRE